MDIATHTLIETATAAGLLLTEFPVRGQLAIGMAMHVGLRLTNS